MFVQFVHHVAIDCVVLNTKIAIEIIMISISRIFCDLVFAKVFKCNTVGMVEARGAQHKAPQSPRNLLSEFASIKAEKIIKLAKRDLLIFWSQYLQKGWTLH